MTRLSWSEYFIDMARLAAQRSTCLRRQVGAVAVRDKRILCTGYNGSPSGLPHCLDVGCLRNELGIESGTRHEICRAVHAEQNLIVQAARVGVSLQGCTVYCTHQPCILCAKLLASVGVATVIFYNPYPDQEAVKLLRDAGVGCGSYEELCL